MMLKLSTPNLSRGFTLLEVMVAISVGLLALGMAGSAMLSARKLYRSDMLRMRVNQNLRGALDVIRMNTQIAGENLNNSFPAVIIKDGADGASDELSLRRNLLDEVLKLCAPLTAGSTARAVFAGGSGPGCSRQDNSRNFGVWRDYRLDQGGAVQAYIFNASNREGEFFEYVNEGDSSGQYWIQRGSGTWAHDYDSEGSAIYLLEEWHFKLQDGALQLLINDDSGAANIAAHITDFQVQALLPDGSRNDEFDASQDWTLLEGVRVSISGSGSLGSGSIHRSMSASFFPRNVLSN